MNRCPAGRALLVALALAPAVARAEGAPPRLAVLGASSGVSASTAAAVARAAAEAARRAGADVVPPEEVERAVLAAGADVATCGTSAACAVAACTAVRADLLLAASVGDGGSVWMVELRLRDARRGSIRGQATEAVARDEGAARDAAARLADRLVQRLLAPATLDPVSGMPLPAPPRPVADLRLAARDDAPAPARSSRRRWGAVLAGGGAALLAGGAVAGVLSWSAANGANASLARGDLGSFAAARQSSRALAWTAAGLGGAGAVALATGSWLWLGGRSSQVSVGVVAGPGASVAVAF